LLWCVRDFYVRGRGTLAPWSPPLRLVVDGLYRYTRNPMYVAVVLILLGWAATFDVHALYACAAAVAVAFHLRVRLHEEPFLARTHGAPMARVRPPRAALVLLKASPWIRCPIRPARCAGVPTTAPSRAAAASTWRAGAATCVSAPSRWRW
jgi:hypothetical protein